MTNTSTRSADVLHFWFGDALQLDWPATDRRALWFGGGAEQDAQITQRFGPLVEQALNGGLHDWEEELPSRMALIVVLDQFTRNVFRGQARAFAGDGRAQMLVLQSLALMHDTQLPRVGSVFLYMPLMHAERRVLQNECVARFPQLLASTTPELRNTLTGHLRHAYQHLTIIKKFGRFPHRNAVLGRDSTPEEIEFLKDGPRFGQ